MPKVIKPSNPFTNVLLGFCFNNISTPPQILAAHRQFSSVNSRAAMMGDGFLLVLLLPVCFELNVC